MTVHCPTFLLSLLFLAGCTTMQRSTRASRSAQDRQIETVNRASINQWVAIEHQEADGVATTLGRSLAVSPDSTRWRDPATGLRHAIPTEALVSVTVRNGGDRGTLWGVSGMLAGIYANRLVRGDVVDPPHRPATSTLTLGGAGLMVGVVYAVLLRHDHRYVFAPPTP